MDTRMRNPIRTLGSIFASVAGLEAAALLAVMLLVEQREARLIASMVLGVQILVFGGIGGGFLLYQKRKQRLKERLTREGYYEMADVVDVVQQLNVQVNGRCPYRVICRILRDGVLHEYRSEMLPYHPGLPAGAQVPVYLDRYDENQYYVDIESVMPPIQRH